MQIIQIVPNLPPSIGGVADYAYLLAWQLREAHGVNTQFVVCGAERKAQSAERLRAPAELDGFPVYQLNERSAAELLRVLAAPEMPMTVLLHYVGYGYEKRGCPVWLARALDAWRKAQSARRLVTMFHELYAFGPPWRSSFWTSPVQRWIAKSLACASDHCFTNRAAFATWLAAASHHPTNAISVLPVFSTVGEPEVLPDWNERPPRLIVFGRASERQQVYFEHQAELEQACRAMNLVEIVDIGAPFEIPQLSVRVSQRGILSAQEISREMLAARAGFFAYPTRCLGKSTIFAAYAAHGLVPITFHGNGVGNEDGLKCSEQFLAASMLSDCKAGQLERAAEKVREWYAGHRLEKQASCFANYLKNEASR
jgi:hypothetical protein